MQPSTDVHFEEACRARGDACDAPSPSYERQEAFGGCLAILIHRAIVGGIHAQEAAPGECDRQPCGRCGRNLGDKGNSTRQGQWTAEAAERQRCTTDRPRGNATPERLATWPSSLA